MNILYIYRGSVNQLSGAGIHVGEVIRNLAQRNTIILLADQGDSFPGTAVTVLPMNIPRIKGFSYIMEISYLIFNTLRVACKNNIDIIYCRDGFSCLCAILLNRIKKVPFVFEVNGILSDESRIRKSGSVSIALTRIFEHIIFKNSDVLICVTEKLKKVIEKRYKKRVYFVPNGANTDLFRPIEDARKRLNLDEQFFYIGYVGSFAPWQGIDILVKAGSEVVKTLSNVKILLAGEHKEEIVKMVKNLHMQEHVIFAGRIPHAEVPLYINASHICVTPKRPLQSGYSPLKLFEYMACGKPVIASRIKGFEILEKVNAGILVEPENSTALAKALITLLQSEEQRMEMGKNGREYVVKNHSWAKISKEIEEICLRTIAEKDLNNYRSRER
jgi:starch synthase